jgi:hypothetical protein
MCDLVIRGSKMIHAARGIDGTEAGGAGIH